ncbi:AMIN domain-containing protein, partial [Pyxidicoccus sp. 3LFB2]
ATSAAPRPRSAAEEKRQRQEEARASRDSRKQETLAMAEPRERPRREVSGGSDASVEVSSRRKTMTLVGFQQQSGASRVFIRTNEPVRYTASEDGRAVVVELENTRIDLSNNTRPLDTSFFSSPVTRVEADSAGRGVRVTIQLRDSVPFQARQEGNLISLDFQRTGR